MPYYCSVCEKELKGLGKVKTIVLFPGQPLNSEKNRTKIDLSSHAVCVAKKAIIKFKMPLGRGAKKQKKNLARIREAERINANRTGKNKYKRTGTHHQDNKKASKTLKQKHFGTGGTKSRQIHNY